MKHRPPELRLLDVPHLAAAHERYDVPSSVPGALLVVLAHRQDWVLREALIGIFWPDLSEADAQHNLRVNLHRLRRQLERWGAGELLVAERRRVAARMACDVADFRGALGRGDWAAAVATHRLPFLSGFALRGFTAFDEWQHSERRALADAWRGAAVKEAQRLELAGESESFPR
jgi:DNA-binding SARP family transcriptional activator